MHAHFFFYVPELSHTSYVHWRECARNFQFMLKVTSQLCYMQFFLFLISTRFPNTSVISMIQKLNYFSTLILSPPIFSIAAAVMRTAFWPLSFVVKSVFFFSATALEKTCHYLLCAGEIDNLLISGFSSYNVMYFGHGYIVMVWARIYRYCLESGWTICDCTHCLHWVFQSSKTTSLVQVSWEVLRNYPSEALLYCKCTT